jgi:hypothetical protein
MTSQELTDLHQQLVQPAYVLVSRALATVAEGEERSLQAKLDEAHKSLVDALEELERRAS